MNNTIAPKEPTEKMLQVLMSEGPFVYRIIGNDYQICERVGDKKQDIIIHAVTNRPDVAHAEVRVRNARWKYKKLLEAMQ